MNMNQIKDVLIAALNNPNFFDPRQSSDAKIQQVVNLIIAVDNTVNK